ncbi:substrate-binding periplasmic protein [Fluviispira multicolorata]|uniref:Transporter substrate-binding domain-containing protein n=1 Tax=Fluviispira multicolorata TaxID=2654512 RepID=A0A833JES2_9BACT|nr:transporter substrate-binding domain-containing protein [Fluviispira multicolorata]KAB8033359.1 transporter substrate-binding domain-containing protein [Fluviispira multicolorata]
MNFKLILFIVIFFLTMNTYASEKVVLHIEGDEWCPYMCDENAIKQKGLFRDITESIFNSQNYEVKFEFMPWARTLKRGEKGEIDAILAAFKEGREKFIFHKIELIQSLQSFVVLKETNWKFKNFNSLKDIHLGLILGYIYGGNIDQIKNNAKKISEIGGENGLEKNLMKLKNKEIDAVLDENHVLQYYIKKLDLSTSMKFTGNIGKRAGLYIGFPKVLPNSQKLADTVDKGLTKMKKSGEYQKILKKYGLTVKN